MAPGQSSKIMAKAKSLRSAHPSASRWRVAIALLVTLTVALQCYVVQTHIHLTPDQSASLRAFTHGIGGDRDHDRYPPGDDPANCPICQEMLHLGQFVAPSAQALLAPQVAISTIAFVETALPFILAVSHNWRGRAPPIA